MGPGGGGRGGGRPAAPPIGTVLDVRGGLINGQIVSEVQKSVAIKVLPKTANAALKHDAAGILGASGPNTFYLTLQKNGGLDRRYAAIGNVIAGLDALKEIKKGDEVRSIRIVRVGQAARDFKTDDEAFTQLMERVTKKKPTVP